MNKLRIIREEFETIFSSRDDNPFDSIIPLIVFFIAYPLFGLIPGSIISVGVGVTFLLIRLITKSPLRYSLAGIGSTLLVAGFTALSGSGTGFVIPGLISGGMTVLICLLSLLFRRPIAAFASHITRRWPLEWYWHDQIRPAYAEVTLIWALSFGVRLIAEYWLAITAPEGLVGFGKIILGWPYTIIILAVSYFYGIWRLGSLSGPSVDEFINRSEPPWKGQSRGF